MTHRKPKKIALLVAGMHRSGTSALTHTLSILGYSLPRNILPANPTNEAGHWEPEDIVSLNEEILAFAGTAWDDILPFDLHRYNSSIIDGFRERALALLEREYGESQLFVLKDPRICRLLSFWAEVIKTFDAEPVIVILIRHPLEVAASLEKRNGIDHFTGCLLWLRHVLDAEANSRGFRRACLQYAALLGESKATMEGLGHTLDLPWPNNATNTWVEIERFLRPELRHHKANDISSFRNFAYFSWLKTSLEICDRWSYNTITQEDMTKLDNIRIVFDRTHLTFHNTHIKGLNRALAESVDESKILKHTLGKRNESIENLSNDLAKRRIDTISLKRSLATLERSLATRNATLAARDAEIIMREREIKALYESRSWRITAPFRHARRMPGALARSIWRKIPLSTQC